MIAPPAPSGTMFGAFAISGAMFTPSCVQRACPPPFRRCAYTAQKLVRRSTHVMMAPARSSETIAALNWASVARVTGTPPVCQRTVPLASIRCA